MKSDIVSELLHYCNVNLKKSEKMEKIIIDYYDFTFMLEGKMAYISNGKEILIKKGDAIFLRPGTIRERRALDLPCSYVSFNFRSKYDNFPFEEHIEGCVTSEMKKIVKVYPFSHLSKFYNSKEKCINMLNYILLELFNFAEIKTTNDHVTGIIRFINENVRRKITLDEICKFSNLSKEYVASIFKKETGKTIIGYINEKKLLLAKEMIINGEMSLSDIAENLGFDNYNYFSRIFKSYFGVNAVHIKKLSRNK